MDPRATAAARGGRRAAPRARPSAPGRSSSTPGNFEPYQGVELLLEALALVPDVQLLLMGGEPAEIARMKARGPGARRRRALRLLRASARPPSCRPSSRWPTSSPRRGRRARTRPSRSTPTSPRASRSWPRASRPTRSSSTTRTRSSSSRRPGPGRGHPRGARRIPRTRRARAGRGRALVEREYSVERYREKIARAYADGRAARPEALSGRREGAEPYAGRASGREGNDRGEPRRAAARAGTPRRDPCRLEEVLRRRRRDRPVPVGDAVAKRQLDGRHDQRIVRRHGREHAVLVHECHRELRRQRLADLPRDRHVELLEHLGRQAEVGLPHEVERLRAASAASASAEETA